MDLAAFMGAGLNKRKARGQVIWEGSNFVSPGGRMWRPDTSQKWEEKEEKKMKERYL